MSDVPTHAELLEIAKRAMMEVGMFSREVLDADGSDGNLVARIIATVGEEVGFRVMRAVTRRSFAAAGPDLDRYITDAFRLPRKTSTAASAVVAFTRAASSDAAALATGFRVGATNGAVFRTAGPVTFPAGSSGPIEVLAVAESVGSIGNVDAAAISRLVSGSAITGLTVTNAEPAAGGSDVGETDEDYRERARRKFAATGGTRASVEFGALLVNGVARVSTTELRDDGVPAARSYLSVVDEDGQGNTLLAEAVLEVLEDYRALGSPVLVVPGVPVYVSVVVGPLVFKAGVNTRAIAASVVEAILEVSAALAPGETLRRAAILRRLERITGLVVGASTLVEPSGDITTDPESRITVRREDIEVLE